MTTARKIEPPDAIMTKEMVDKTLQGIQKAESDVVTRLGNRVSTWFRGRATAHNFVVAAIGMGLLVTVREVDRQRRAVEKIREANDAMIQYVKVMVDETDCGQEAYVYLQIMAEDEEVPSKAAEEVAVWATEDEQPIADQIIVIEE